MAWAIIPERPAHVDVDYDVSSEPVYEDQHKEDSKTDQSKNGNDDDPKYYDI